MPTRAHHRSRVVATACVAAAHAYLASIGSVGYLNFTVRSDYPLLHELASSTLWTWLHAIAAVAILASLTSPYRHCWVGTPRATVACSFGFAIMLVWSVFNFLWGFSTIRPVSLAGPGLALAVAAGEQLLAHAWNREATTKDG
jgi:hypothetical protein